MYCFLPNTLAAISADDRGTLLLYIVSGIITLTAMVASVAKIYEAFFKKPTSSDPVTRAELDTLEQTYRSKFREIDQRFLDLDKEIRNLLITLQSELRGINRSIGRLDGLISSSKKIDTEHIGPGE